MITMTTFGVYKSNAMRIVRPWRQGWLAGVGLVLLGLVLSTPRASAAEWVLFQEGKMFAEHAGTKIFMEETITFPGAIRILTNGTFTVNGGKERKLQEGQVLNADGTLISLDGTIIFVVDHVTLEKGKV